MIRLWWAFYLYGKHDVRVLDGGYDAWIKQGYETNLLAPVSATPGNFTAKTSLAKWTVDDAYIKASERTNTMQLWDTREPKEWTGEELKKGAFRKGRIPSARFLNWKNFRANDGTFLSADKLTALIDRSGFDSTKHQVFYCQSGVRTTQELFGLYLLGWPTEKLQNFDGSWIAWSYNSDNAVVCEKCESPAVALQGEPNR